MPIHPLARTLARAATRAPGVKDLPVVKRLPLVRLLAAADLVLLTRDHVQRLTPPERRRVLTLLRVGRGRRSRLSDAQRDELSALVAKAEPRLLAGHAVEAISPIPLPRRLVYGHSKR